ncbi:MAG: EAL domain-containing protein, partial [Hyphomicrobiales bacterium]|nr:EAL domain-containing protein [Hyphomicrobiales bacterium]
LSTFARTDAKHDDASSIKDLMTANNSLGQDQSLLRRRMDRLESAMASGHTAAAEQLDSQVQALEHSVSALTRQHAPDEPQASGAPLRAQPAPAFSAGPREVDLFLEPIVRLSENRTAYYRATLSVRHGDGERLPLSRIAREAERDGYLGELDLSVFERAVPVIRRLQNKGRDISVFCPVNASSFAEETFMQSLLALLDDNADIANALVVEITHTTLSQLSDRGQEGLAHLAQLGATFALSNVHGAVPDLVTLQELGFAFVAADVRLLVALKNESQHSADTLFSQIARSRLQLVAADVTKQSELAWIEDVVPLAYGAYFSPPRLVRHDITEPQEHAKVA